MTKQDSSKEVVSVGSQHNKSEVVENIPDQAPEDKREIVEMLFSKIVSDGPELTESQIDKIIEQRGKIIDYKHKDNQTDSYDGRFKFVGLGIIFILLTAGVLVFQPDYLGEIVALFIGGLGGYGIGSHRK